MKVAFLDRDGVVNEYPGDGEYVKNWKEFKFIPGSTEGIKNLHRYGFKIFIISNQAGVAKGIYRQKDLDKINKKMQSHFKKNGVSLSGVYCCTHLAEDNCTCRKPKIGLLDRAVSELGANPQVSFFIGDSFVDMKAARSFGAKPILVLSGKEKISNRNNWEFEPDYVFDNLLIAAHYLCSRHE